MELPEANQEEPTFLWEELEELPEDERNIKPLSEENKGYKGNENDGGR